MSDMQSAPMPDPAQAKAIEQAVEDHGCAVMHVTDTGVPGRNFSYSIGFERSAEQPEVLVYGLAKDLMHSMINEVFRQCREEKLVLTDGATLSNLLEGFDCQARIIEDPVQLAKHFGHAGWFHHSQTGEPLKRAVQIVWPDPKTRKFPWEEGCAEDVVNWQSALYPKGGAA